MARKKISIPKRRLFNLYWRKNKSTYFIAKVYNCNFGTITNRLREYKIPFKSHSRARIKYEKFEFSGTSTEKAYMIGFRLGDLNIYKTSSRSDVIIARTSTTRVEQIELVRTLFKDYGHITVSRLQDGTFCINCYLDNSFSFLLPKHDLIESWIKTSRRFFSAFIAGYVDAEGSFGINQEKARFKIDAYDKHILSEIHEWLSECKIESKLWRVGKKGQMRPEGYRFNKDLWRLNLNIGYDISRFCDLLSPYLRHKKRIKDMKIVRMNIRKRREKGTLTWKI